jgi:cellulose synthase (UDP-forming)
MGRYFVWRTIATLNLSTWLSATMSVSLYIVEAIGCFSMLLYSLQTIWSNADKRSRQADRLSQDVLAGRYLPSVDVFVPTYSEPDFIVRRTVVGCQAMDYPNKTVYILDDSQRPHMRALAEELGCEYITRTQENHHAKAGNLNNALPQTHGELITVIDSDFVPFKNYLTRIVGFFQDPKVGLVQTPQDFYNPDHHARNLGIDHLIPNDLANFFRMAQSTRDPVNSVVCCGTSYVIRRKALEEIGGYYHRCLAEDSPTSTFLLTKGYRLIYLNETLSMGESTRNYSDFLKQRLRWLQGNLQLFYCTNEVPIWTKLNIFQKSHMVMQFIGCFNPLFRAIFLLSPLVSIYLGVSAISAPLSESLYYLAPYMLFMVITHAWAADYHTSYFWNEVYEVIFCFPGLQRLFFTLRHPFGRSGFVVTPKGVTTSMKRYNLQYTWPLLVVIGLSVLAIVLHVGGAWAGVWETIKDKNFNIVFFWLLYNVVLMTVAVLAAIDQPERRTVDRYPLHTICKLTSGDRAYWGYTEDVSEGGASLILNTHHLMLEDGDITVELPEHGLVTTAEIRRVTWNENTSRVGVAFVHVTADQSRKLVTMLYSEMTWWKRCKRPSTLDTMLAIVSSFLQFRPILSKYGR